MFVKMHMCGNDRLLAACDEDVLGKTFSGNGMQLKVGEGFYKGESVSAEELARRMRYATIMNLVGDECVSVAVSEGFADAGSVIDVGGVKHVQVVMM